MLEQTHGIRPIQAYYQEQYLDAKQLSDHLLTSYNDQPFKELLFA